MSERYAVIGNPIAHSKSPLIHTAFARACHQDIEYQAIETTAEGFADAVRAFRDGGGRGLNVTTPFKTLAFELADSHSERAGQAGAANTLVCGAAGIHAENFDGIALVRDIQDNLSFPLLGRRVLLLGAGGAVRAALAPILAQQPLEVLIADRTGEKATQLARTRAPAGVAMARLRGCALAQLGATSLAAFDLVINGTSASLRGELPALPVTAWSAGGMAYEMAYGRGLTPFLRLARSAGVTRLADGVGMLVEQAADAFHLWRGVRPATRAVIEMLRVPLS